jgi:AcrR family transcriptional regulator
MKPQSLRSRLKEATNGAILSSAEEVFGRDGLRDAKMEEIAHHAGVSVGTLYNHFRDRESLLLELLEARQVELFDRLDGVLETSKAEPFDKQLRQVIECLIGYVDEHPAFLKIKMAGEHLGNCRTFSKQARKTLLANNLYERMVLLVRRGVNQKALRREEADLFPSMLMGMTRSLMYRKLYHSDPDAPPAPSIDQMVRFFLRGAGV